MKNKTNREPDDPKRKRRGLFTRQGCITMLDRHWKTAKALGEGNISLGIRRALEAKRQ